MGDENPIRALGDYSKPSHEGYKNTIELPIGNNVVPPRSETIWLVQNGCSFHGLWFDDPNQHLKDFLKLMDSLVLDGENRERTRLRLFQYSLRDQASNWLERLLAGSITTWEDLTTQKGFLATANAVIDCRMDKIAVGEGITRSVFSVKGVDLGEEETPYKDPETSELSREGYDLLSSRVILSEDDYYKGCRKPSDLKDGFYRDTIKLGPEYVTRMDDEGEVTLYLTRRSLEVLRKFHWMILGVRFNQLSHVSSPLLSKPEEY
nr:zinc finger, CCHC-type [Tanacetum cinerariifolium]